MPCALRSHCTTRPRDSSATDTLEEVLRDHTPQNVGQGDLNPALFFRAVEPDDAVDRRHGRRRVQSGQNEMASVGGLEG